MENFLNKLLKYYSLDYEEYLKLCKPLNEISLIDPLKIKGMDKVLERINLAIERKEKIIVYGDYDCDGFCATSIMVKTFKMLNYPVASYIPSRYLDGYGLNIKNVKKIANSNYKLIICVDNGISAHEAISYAKNQGIDVIVIDHHDVPPLPVESYATIHPTVSEISPIIGSGGYMSLFVSAALLNRYDDYLVTLAGLSTISDLMELKDYNRDITRLAIDNLQKNQYLSLKLLLSSSIIDEKSFGLEIAPKINSIGRVIEDTTVNRVVKYLTSDDEDEIRSLNDWILDINEKRKELVNEVVKCLPLVENSSGICLLTNMKEGLIGLVANRLLNEYSKPSIVFTSSDINPDNLKGSIRSKEGFNVSHAYESLKKYIINGGGHALAGGLEIKKIDFESFKNDFLKLCEEHPLVEEESNEIEISLSDITFDNYEIYKSFSPFGMGFKEPNLVLKNIPTKSLSFISFGKHLSTALSIRSKLLGFNMPENEIKANSTINLYGSFNLSEFRGIKTLEFRVTKYTK